MSELLELVAERLEHTVAAGMLERAGEQPVGQTGLRGRSGPWR